MNTFAPGYGLFWVVNSVNTTILGGKNRNLQAQIAADNEAFQLEMEQARIIAQDEAEAEKIAYKRRMMALSREWYLEESAKSYDIQLKAIELQTFIKNWPLDLRPNTILQETKRLLGKTSGQIPMNIILLRTPLIAGTKGQITNREAFIIREESDIYREIEYSIKHDDEPIIGNVNFRQDACSKVFDGNADIMNIHFLMSSMPTLVIAPKYQDGRMYFTAGAWDSQTSRPLIRPLLNMAYDPALAQSNKEYRNEVIDNFHSTISIIAGTIRDSYYTITSGRTPTLGQLLEAKPKMKQLATSEPNVAAFLESEKNNMLAALDSKNVPNLLEAYHEKDLEQMKSFVSKGIDSIK